MANLMKRFLPPCILFLFIALNPFPAQAQLDFGGSAGVIDWNAQWLAEDSLRRSRENEKRLRRQQQARETRARTRSSSTNKPVAIIGQKGSAAHYSFLNSPRENIANSYAEVFLQQARLSNPDGLSDAMESSITELVRGLDIVDQVYNTMIEVGLPKNNVATANTYWVATNFRIIEGVTMSTDRYQTLFRQLEGLILNNPKINGMSDADKQETAEAMIWEATLQQMGYNDAKKNNRGNEDAIIADSRNTLRKHGIDPAKFKITDEGLVAR